MRAAAGSEATAFDRLYSVIVAGKGVHGLLELLAGLALLVAPDATGGALAAVAAELAEGGSPLRAAAAHSLASAGSGIAAGAVPLAVFLLVHGVVKMLTVVALLRRAVRWYPWALGALGVLLVVQLADLVTAPALGGGVLACLDVAVIALVSWEYRRLMRQHAGRREAGRVVRDRAMTE